MKKISMVRAVILTSLISIPLAVFAQSSMDVKEGFSTLGGVVKAFNDYIVKALITLFATGAMAAFFFGIVQFIWGVREGDGEKAKKGKYFMLWGMIALFVMFSVWGIIQYAQDIFKIRGQNTIVIPSIEIKSGGTNNQNPFKQPADASECTSFNNGAICGSGITKGRCEISNGNSVCVQDASECTSSNIGAVCGSGINKGQCEISNGNSVCVPDAYKI